jgi:predicted lysophospholipase L1 biosynthesis ABC-type transport system permease subunit
LGDENPIGQQVTGGGVTYQIIGVVGDIKSRTLGEDLRPVLYRSLAQSVAGDPSVMGYSLLIRISGNPAALVGGVRSEIRSLDPAMAIFNVETMEQHLRDALFLPRLAATLFGVFGFTGLALAGVGLYGVMSYSVSRRTREIGIRLALGAPIGRVRRLIVRQGMGLTAIAVALGLPAAFAVAKFSTSLLYGVRAHDPVTFIAVPLFLATIAFLACWLPARRATRLDPQAALRCE